MRKTKHRTETKGGKGAHHAGTKKKEKPPPSQVRIKTIITVLSHPLSFIKTSSLSRPYFSKHDAMVQNESIGVKVFEMHCSLVFLTEV